MAESPKRRFCSHRVLTMRNAQYHSGQLSCELKVGLVRYSDTATMAFRLASTATLAWVLGSATMEAGGLWGGGGLWHSRPPLSVWGRERGSGHVGERSFVP